ncbi:hypothetical protein C4D60_Mb09t00490 [Musa balbisiana]|uniref:SHSP domain-containing protein n=1 Tax=Musa balbisiana TaxID=52838 RepID=A0A4S8IEB8_MUSBA|nr:hypothetical protein C4D60_Mb09t00490 [Musa balbisiana]
MLFKPSDPNVFNFEALYKWGKSTSIIRCLIQRAEHGGIGWKQTRHSFQSHPDVSGHLPVIFSPQQKKRGEQSGDFKPHPREAISPFPTMSIVRRSNIFDPFSLDVWDPFQGFPFDAFRSLAETRPGFVSETSAFANTRIDWKETPEAHVFKADLPGVKKEEVKVEVEEGRVLQISGERSKEEEEKSDKWHRVERSSGKFLRRFRLPENAKVDQQNIASYSHVEGRSNIFDPFSLDVWDPFQGFPFDSFRSLSETRPSFVSETSAFANTRIDWMETPEAHVFKADLPGVKKEEVRVEVEEGGVLQISGERSKEEEEKSLNPTEILLRRRATSRGVTTLPVLPIRVFITMSIVRRSNIFDPFSLDVWDPFQGFPFDSFRSLSETRPSFVSETSAFANTRIDWMETPEAHVFKADLPGVEEEEVRVEVEEGGVLQISGERSKEEEEKSDKWHRVERSSGKFLRRFRLPENAKVDQVKASMENGFLTVTVPKEEVKKPEMKSIEISG